MLQIQKTQVSPMKIRKGSLADDIQPVSQLQVNWRDVPKRSRGEAFAKNLSVAAALVLCAVTLRTGTIPPLNKATDAVMTAVTDQSLLDEQLGKLSFVSALFPEAVLVFGDSRTEQLAMPVSSGTIIHTWSEAEPYISWRTSTLQVTASSAGEVMGVYHGNGDERLVQIAGNDGLSCLYGNLSEVSVQIGDSVTAGEAIGTLLPGEDFVFEVRKEGRSIDPALYLSR